MKKKTNQDWLDLMHRNPSNWRGVIYFNNKDPRLIVPKLNQGMGWTFNFGSINTYILIVSVILILVLANIFL